MIHDEQWFEEAFTNPVTNEPYVIPDDIRTAATRIVRSYGIKGICDPMYIANVIAKELGRGDGLSHFDDVWRLKQYEDAVSARKRPITEQSAFVRMLEKMTEPDLGPVDLID